MLQWSQNESSVSLSFALSLFILFYKSSFCKITQNVLADGNHYFIKIGSLYFYIFLFFTFIKTNFRAKTQKTKCSGIIVSNADLCVFIVGNPIINRSLYFKKVIENN